MHQNFAIQTVINSFLSNPSTSPIFATILIEYLLKRMKDLGSTPALQSRHHVTS